MSGFSRRKVAQVSVSIDGAGRVVLPKALRDSLHLLPGEPLVAEQRDDEIVIRRKEQSQGLVTDCGLLVYDSGAPPASIDMVSWIDDDRERRLRHAGGEADKH